MPKLYERRRHDHPGDRSPQEQGVPNRVGLLQQQSRHADERQKAPDDGQGCGEREHEPGGLSSSAEPADQSAEHADQRAADTPEPARLAVGQPRAVVGAQRVLPEGELQQPHGADIDRAFARKHQIHFQCDGGRAVGTVCVGQAEGAPRRRRGEGRHRADRSEGAREVAAAIGEEAPHFEIALALDTLVTHFTGNGPGGRPHGGLVDPGQSPSAAGRPHDTKRSLGTARFGREKHRALGSPRPGHVRHDLLATTRHRDQ